MVGTWVIYIPHIKEKLQIDDGQLGIAMFCYALGTFFSIPLVPFMVKKYGVGRCTGVGILLFALSFLLPIQATTHIFLCAALFLTGSLSGFTDVAMNALVTEIEKEDDVKFMSVSHGFFSLGGVIGAGIGGLLLSYFEIPLWHMAIATTFVIVTNLLMMKFYSSQVSFINKEENGGYNMRQILPLMSLAFIALIIMGSEGAIEHWSKLFLMEEVDVSSEVVAGYGYIVFSAMMTLGRFLGDGISSRIGSYNIIIGGTALGSLGYLLILSSSLHMTIAGFGILGLGFSVIIPELFRVAGNYNQVSSATAISFVSGIGFTGFLLAPVILGFIAKHYNLTMSFMSLCGVALVALVIAIGIKFQQE